MSDACDRDRLYAKEGGLLRAALSFPERFLLLVGAIWRYLARALTLPVSRDLWRAAALR